MSDVERIKKLLQRCSRAEREDVFRLLRPEFTLHPLEEQLHAKNDDWSDDFSTAVKWLREGRKKTIGG